MIFLFTLKKDSITWSIVDQWYIMVRLKINSFVQWHWCCKHYVYYFLDVAMINRLNSCIQNLVPHIWVPIQWWVYQIDWYSNRIWDSSNGKDIWVMAIQDTAGKCIHFILKINVQFTIVFPQNVVVLNEISCCNSFQYWWLQLIAIQCQRHCIKEAVSVTSSFIRSKVSVESFEYACIVPWNICRYISFRYIFGRWNWFMDIGNFTNKLFKFIFCLIWVQ